MFCLQYFKEVKSVRYVDLSSVHYALKYKTEACVKAQYVLSNLGFSY